MSRLEQIVAPKAHKQDLSEEVEEVSVDAEKVDKDLVELSEDDPRELGERSLSDIFNEGFED